MRMDPIVLPLERSAGELDVGVRKLAQVFPAGAASRAQQRAGSRGVQKPSSGKHAPGPLTTLHFRQLVPRAILLAQQLVGFRVAELLGFRIEAHVASQLVRYVARSEEHTYEHR